MAGEGLELVIGDKTSFGEELRLAPDDASDGGAYGFSHAGAFASRSSLSSQSQAAPRTPAESPCSGLRIGVPNSLESTWGRMSAVRARENSSPFLMTHPP